MGPNCLLMLLSLPPGEVHVIHVLYMVHLCNFNLRLDDSGLIIRQICGDKIADSCKHVWDIDEDGEFSGCWRDLGFPGLWYMTGTF